MTIVVTPELLTTTQNVITTALEHATAIANGYLAEQENVANASTWSGQAVGASMNTAAQLNHDLQQTITGGHRLAQGLGQSALLMGNHEADASQSLNGVFGGSAS